MRLVAFGRHLQGATLLEGSFDFSLAFAVIEWIEQAVNGLRAVPAAFDEISRGVSSVKEVVSLSTGTGLIDIWRNMSPRHPAAPHSDKMTELEKADRHLSSFGRDISE